MAEKAKSVKPCVQVYLDKDLYEWLEADRKARQVELNKDLSRSEHAAEIIEAYAKSNGYTEKVPPSVDEIEAGVMALVASEPERVTSLLTDMFEAIRKGKALAI